LLESAGFLEEVRAAGNCIEANRCFHPPQRLLVHFDYDSIATPNDEQRWSVNVGQFLSRQIGTATSRHDRIHAIGPSSRRDKRRAGASARSEQAHREPARIIIVVQPPHRPDQTIREQSYVEPNAPGEPIDLLLRRRKQIEEQRSKISAPQLFGDIAIPRGMAAASASVGEHDQRTSIGRNRQITFEGDSSGVDLDGSFSRVSGVSR